MMAAMRDTPQCGEVLSAEQLLQTLIFTPGLSTISARVWAFLLLHPGVTGGVCARMTGINPNAVRDVVGKLERNGLVRRDFERSGQRPKLFASPVSAKALILRRESKNVLDLEVLNTL